MGLLEEFDNLLGTSKPRKSEIKEYHIEKEELIKTFNIKGKVTSLNYDTKKQILIIKVKQ